MEIEAKVRLKDPAKLRASLKAAGAVFEGRVLERNWLFDSQDRTLSRKDKLLRLREDRRVSLAFKGPRQNSEFKKRQELEIEFPDAPSAQALLESIGFGQWFYYEKIRETWRLHSSEIVLDELPNLGLFVEVEAPTEEEVSKTLKKLKLSRDYIKTTYVEMLQELSNSSDLRREFKFPALHKSG